MSKFSEIPHKRYNPLTGEWVLVSPHRNKRPWQGQVEKTSPKFQQTYNENCYLCPGNIRSNGEKNPDYENVYSFTNDFSALLENTPSLEENEDGLFISKSEKGICKVICFSSRHDLTIPNMSQSGVEEVIKLWIKEYSDLSKKEFINYIQIFENKGEMMGCSNPHPHGQIWATENLPNEIIKKQKKQLEFYKQHKQTLLAVYLKKELEKRERIIFENESFVVLVPYWAVWPFETMIIPKRAMPNILLLKEDEISNFAEAYQLITKKYDALFDCSFPYSAGIHQSPCDNLPHLEWHWHFSFYPPLLRSASVKKFMVGYEMFATPQRDITAEQAAESLRKI